MQRYGLALPGGADRKPLPQYDSKVVERLQRRLIDALCNATHIRNLPPAGQIVVVIHGREGVWDPAYSEAPPPGAPSTRCL